MNEPGNAIQVPVGGDDAEVNLRSKMDEIHKIYGQNLITTYYRIGVALVEVMEDQVAGGLRYGKGAMDRIAEEFNMSSTNLYRCQEVAVHLNWDDIKELVDNPNIKWSHIREVVRVPDSAARVTLLQGLTEEPMTVADFKERVDQMRGSPTGGDGAPEPTGENRGGGSRTGSGHGASPLTPIKKSRKIADQLGDMLKDALESVSEFNPDTEAAAERITDALNETLGSVCDVITVAAGFIEKSEQHMSCYPNKLRETAQAARSAAYAQSVTVLGKMATGIDAGTLGPEADPNKEEPPKPERLKTAAKKPRKAAAKKPESPPVAAPLDPKADEEVAPSAEAGVDKEALIAEMREKARLARERAQQQRSGQ